MGKKSAKKVKKTPDIEEVSPPVDSHIEDEKDEESNEPVEDVQTLNFHEMELDDRLLKVMSNCKGISRMEIVDITLVFQAIAKLRWLSPTLVQEKAIPLLLEGKDVLVRARTGSGKTAAFSIPVIQKILNSKQTDNQQCIKALILAPSKELCNQVS